MAQRFERSENALDVVAGLIETNLNHTIRYGLFVLYWGPSIRARPSLTWFAVSRSSGPFHTRQFASKLSVADVYESRHNKAAYQIKAWKRGDVSFASFLPMPIWHMSHTSWRTRWLSGSSVVRTHLVLLPVWFGMVYFYMLELSIYPLAVSCSSGPFHTRQFASKLSVADVYESRHNKPAHKLKVNSPKEKPACLFFCEGWFEHN